jgi:hypothetical protein
VADLSFAEVEAVFAETYRVLELYYRFGKGRGVFGGNLKKTDNASY